MDRTATAVPSLMRPVTAAANAMVVMSSKLGDSRSATAPSASVAGVRGSTYFDSIRWGITTWSTPQRMSKPASSATVHHSRTKAGDAFGPVWGMRTPISTAGAQTLGREAHDPGQVAAHDLGDVLPRQGLQPVGVVGRAGQALGVRVVGAEQHAVRADEGDDVHRVVLVERVHPDAALERGDRVLGEQVRVEVVAVLEGIE